MKIFISGAGGFIGGHLSKKLKLQGHEIVGADIKPLDFWFQNNCDKTFVCDLKEIENCIQVTEGVDYIYNLACNMGGMGFIENNKAECMLSVLINTNLLRASLKNKIKKFFFSSSACAYNINDQKNPFVEGLVETSAYPAMPEDGYGWEKLFSERMCRHFTEDFNLDTKIVRYHNIYGPLGTYDGGREKAPAALCRKIAEAKINNIKEIEVWGDGEQTRTFLFIDDCLDGAEAVFNSKKLGPYNVGSDEQVSINQMIDIIEEIADYKVKRIYDTSKPKGVRGRSSNNNLIKKEIGWSPKIKLKEGLKLTYDWIFNELSKENNRKSNKFTRA
jgi:GDP-D-mannose 3', 5'-epimerase